MPRRTMTARGRRTLVLLDLMAERAILPNRPAVTRLVGIVVATKATRLVDVPELRTIGAPRHVHFGKDILLVQTACRSDQLRHVRIRSMVPGLELRRDPGAGGRHTRVGGR